MKLKKVTILAQQNPFVISMIEPFKAEMAKLGGTVMDVIQYNPDQASYRAEVEKAFGPEPDGVFCLSLLTDFVAITKEVYRGGIKSKILGLGTGADADGAYLKSVSPEVAEGIHHLQPAPPMDSAAYKKFVKLMGAPEGTAFLFAGNTHDQVCVTALAMEHAKSHGRRGLGQVDPRGLQSTGRRGRRHPARARDGPRRQEDQFRRRRRHRRFR